MIFKDVLYSSKTSLCIIKCASVLDATKRKRGNKRDTKEIQNQKKIISFYLRVCVRMSICEIYVCHRSQETKPNDVGQAAPWGPRNPACK